MDELNKRYARLVSQYDQHIDDALTSPSNINQKFDKIAEINTQISATLDEMIRIVTLSKQSTSQLVLYRDELLKKLAKIQGEYDSLTSSRDKLETLRRIREFQDESWRRSLYLYLIAFLALALFVGIVLLWKGSYTKETSAAIPTRAATMDAFT